jgi:hypothetical protein
MIVLQARKPRCFCCGIAASGGSSFLGPAPRELVNYGVSGRVHFMAQKSNSASSFGNNAGHHR